MQIHYSQVTCLERKFRNKYSKAMPINKQVSVSIDTYLKQNRHEFQSRPPWAGNEGEAICCEESTVRGTMLMG